MPDAILPDSTAVDAPPIYSSEPSCGEQRLELTPSHASGDALLTDTVVKKFGKITLALHDQQRGAEIPSYGRRNVINGVFCFDDPANIARVTIAIRGNLENSATEFGAKSVSLINDRHILWRVDDASNLRCPNQLPFSCIIPATYIENREIRPLPPSFYIFFPGLYVKTYYHLSIEIARIRRSRFDLSSSIKNYSVPFYYFPRARPNRPIDHTLCFLSSVKALPEEWYQSSSTLQTLPNQPSREPLHCNFFVPSVRVFGFKDSIPFHIQLTGPASSLRELIPPDVIQRIWSFDSSLSACSDRQKRSGKKVPEHRDCIQVQLMRQVVVSDNGLKSWRNTIIGKGVVHPLPPSLALDQFPNSKEECLDWEGSVKCNEGVQVGNFTTHSVQLQHFISLTLTSPDTRRSPFREFNIHVPVKIVSDSYSEFG